MLAIIQFTEDFCKDNFVFKIAKILYYNIINDAESWNYTMNESIRLESPKKKGKKNDCKC